MKGNNLFANVSAFLIKNFWQEEIGPKYKKKHNIICRFYPDCSNYSIRALKRYGFLKGWFFTYKRIKRCNQENTESCIDYP